MSFKNAQLENEQENQFDSDTLNTWVREVCYKPKAYGYECFPNSGKVIPFIGEWRDINFNQSTYEFGIVPPDEESDDPNEQIPLVGFMERNLWNYPTVTADEEEFQKIKWLLIKACYSRRPNDFKQLNEYIQGLKHKIYCEC
jgi:hypothetical protein